MTAIKKPFINKNLTSTRYSLSFPLSSLVSHLKADKSKPGEGSAFGPSAGMQACAPLHLQKQSSRLQPWAMLSTWVLLWLCQWCVGCAWHSHPAAPCAKELSPSFQTNIRTTNISLLNHHFVAESQSPFAQLLLDGQSRSQRSASVSFQRQWAAAGQTQASSVLPRLTVPPSELTIPSKTKGS